MYVEKTLGVEGLGWSFNWKVFSRFRICIRIGLATCIVISRLIIRWKYC